MTSINRESTLNAIGETPLLELSTLSPMNGARILLKWEGANPTGSIKDRMALAMINGAERDGHLAPGQPIVESTGGSTGTGLALVCAVKGYPLFIVTADCYSDEKIKAMRALGATVEVMKTSDGSVSSSLNNRMRKRAQEIQREKGAYFMDQFHNEHQLKGYTDLAEEIHAGAPNLTDFVTVVGTGGTAVGTSQRLLALDSNVTVSLVEPAESPVLSEGRAESHGIEGVAAKGSPPLIPNEFEYNVITVPEAEGKQIARELASDEGLLAGASTGLNTAAAIQRARNRPKNAVIVTIAADTGLKYLTKDLYRPS